jgi:hypothetical protein
LKILLVLGEQSNTVSQSGEQLATPVAQGIASVSKRLHLESEAAIIARIITQSSTVENAFVSWVPAEVKTLIQPTTAKLSEVLDTGNYNVFFYAGHGIPAPDGGLIFLQSAQAINGTELAQILVRNQITLAVFNACWGAQSAQQGEKVLERSSLAEVLIHHGVPAVLGMRDSIADQEAFSFIQAFTKALTQRSSIDLAVTLARQHLLTLYRFNQPAWTLPILYMHPEFNGELIQPINQGTTELPMTFLDLSSDPFPVAYIHSLDEVNQVWEIHGGSMRIGRGVLENDLIIQEKWVSTNHAAIFCRDTSSNSDGQYSYFLKDFSKFGTYIFYSNEWHKIHHQEVALHSGVKLKFGSQRGRVLEFVIDS